MRVSRIIKICAYVFMIGYLLRETFYITIDTSYLNTGELMGVESMFLMIWAAFIAFLFSLFIYGLGEIVEYFEKAATKVSDDLTKNEFDVKSHLLQLKK